jgi:hypothetical protein
MVDNRKIDYVVAHVRHQLWDAKKWEWSSLLQCERHSQSATEFSPRFCFLTHMLVSRIMTI